MSNDKNEMEDLREEGKPSNSYSIFVCIFASMGGLFFGYDQGVTGGVLLMPSFVEDFCIDQWNATKSDCTLDAIELPQNWTTYTTLFNVIYYLGCIFGSGAASYTIERFGRRACIFSASLLFSMGTIWVIATPSGYHNVALCGRFVEGMGVGTVSFATPIYGAEMAPPKLRGMLSGFMQMMVVTGLLLAGIANSIVAEWQHGWRITNGLVLLPAFILLVGIFLLPESPRWIFQAKSKDKSRIALCRLRKTKDVEDELAGFEISNKVSSQGNYAEIFHKPYRLRLSIVVMLHILQQATGINPMFTYGGLIFESILKNGILSLLILQAVNFISTIPALYFVDHIGRRSLLLYGAAGMVLGHLSSGLLFQFGCQGTESNSTCTPLAGWSIVACTSMFIFSFAMSWGPICWIYPPEIFPTRLRSKAVSISTMTNWTMGAFMIGIPKLFPLLRIHGVYYTFSILCALAGLFVYRYCPETKRILLEEVDALFENLL